MNSKLIGFIGQGWIGKNYADDFEERGYSIVRYAKEEPYDKNKEKIKECDIVFIAVPTPTINERFSHKILSEVLPLIGEGKIAVIKSTILPGTTEVLQKENPNIMVFHAPEFLTEVTARFDASHPARNIVGIPEDTDAYRNGAKQVLDVLPHALYKSICSSLEAELIKYGGNVWFYFKVIYINMLYDLAEKSGASWENIRDALAADPRIGRTHLDPVHKSGRGAGGHCFIKDFSAFHEAYKSEVGDPHGLSILEGLKNKNIELLLKSDKDLDLLEGVYGDLDAHKDQL